MAEAAERSDPPELTSEEEEEEDEDEKDESDGQPVETLVAGRERRSNAGNKYSSLLAGVQEDADDDLNLLFAEEEAEEDVEFDDPEAAEVVSEAEDELSSDEDDKGPAVGEDDLEGEKQLEKEERARKRDAKRKADKAFAQAPAVRKRVKIDDSPATSRRGSTQISEKQRKKSERISWIPTDADAPVRTSSRTLAVQNKERTLASMKESETRRLRQIAIMEAAQRRKSTEKVKTMTQEERMAEALEVERLNSKSLNKWETTERDRIEKQKARLEALQNRTLEGPVIRFYSGPADWLGDKLVHVGKKSKVEELEIVQPAVQQEHTKAFAAKVLTGTPSTKHACASVEAAVPTTVVTDVEAMKPSLPLPTDAAVPSSIESTINPPTTDETAPKLSASDATSGQVNLLNGLECHALLPEGAPQTGTAPQTYTQRTSPVVNQLTAPQQPSIPRLDDSIAQDKSDVMEMNTITSIDPLINPSQPQSTSISQCPDPITPAAISTSEPSQPTPPPPMAEKSTRNLIHLLNFDPVALRDKDIQRRILFSWPAPPPSTSTKYNSSTKDAPIGLNAFTPTTTRRYVRANGPAQSAFAPAKPVQAVCAITGERAKYRDPMTGLPYSGLEAFRAIRGLVEGKGKATAVWSNLLEAWVGPAEKNGGMRAARGVPEGFSKGVSGKDESVRSGRDGVDTISAI